MISVSKGDVVDKELLPTAPKAEHAEEREHEAVEKKAKGAEDI